MTRNTNSVGDKDASRQAEFIANDYEILKRTDDYPDGDWCGETENCELTERVVDLLNACAGIQNPAAIPNLIKAALEAVEASSRHSTKEGTDRAMNQAIRDLFKAYTALDSPVPAKD